MDVNSELHMWLSRARSEELRRAAARAVRPPELPEAPASIPVTLRFAFPDDADALVRLALLDSSKAPSSPVLLAEVGGELHAALSLADGHVIADPFRPTAALIELLRARARQLDPGAPRRRLLWPRIAIVRWRSVWR